MTIISSTDVRTHARVHFHKLSVIFPFKFDQFLRVFDFLMLIDQERVENTFALDAPIRKNHRKLGWGS